MALKLHVVVHGSGASTLRDPGCPCPRCVEPVLPASPSPQDYGDLLAWVRQANTSVSLVIEEDGVAIDHTLVDCGLGVVSNLAALPTPARGQPVTRVLLTHGHMDHIGGLPVLLFSLQKARMADDFAPAEQPWPLPIFATRRTWRERVGADPGDPARGGILRGDLDALHYTDLTEAARDLIPIALHPALQAWAIPAEHVLDSVNFRFAFWPSGIAGQGPVLRFACCWDLDHFPTGSAGEAWDGIMLNPAEGPLRDLMQDLDLLLIEMTNWRPRAGHLSFERDEAGGRPGVRDLLEWWQPRMTRIMHYSGWFDRHLPDGTWQRGDAAAHNVNPATGPVADRHLRRALRAALDAPEVDVAQPGMALTFGEDAEGKRNPVGA